MLTKARCKGLPQCSAEYIRYHGWRFDEQLRVLGSKLLCFRRCESTRPNPSSAASPMPSVRQKRQDTLRQNENAPKVIVGMSGGVDSSVAAYLLQQQGFVVEGLFMKNWDEDDGTEYCTAIADLEDAQQVSDQLGITLHTANFAAEYWDNVFSHFLKEYQNWRTPNPDILCNREIKFEQFVRYAETLGADYIATGHYVRRSPIPESNVYPSRDLEEPIRFLKGLDANKDQTYFLQAVPEHKLARCLFPLGDWQKPDIRGLAEALGLTNHQVSGLQNPPIPKEHRIFGAGIRQHIFRRNGIELTAARQVKTYQFGWIGFVCQIFTDLERHNSDTNRVIDTLVDNDRIQVRPTDAERKEAEQ